MQAIGAHLAVRAHHGFTRNEVLAEIALLGSCISQVLDALPASDRPSTEEVRQLLAELYLTSLAVASTFDEHAHLPKRSDDPDDPESVHLPMSVLMHDLSGPLDAAQAHATTLLHRTTGDAHDAAAGIVRELERMRQAVSALLNAHRAQVSRMEPR
jgi:hypothetical protein